MALFGKGFDCLHEYDNSVSIDQQDSLDSACGRSAAKVREKGSVKKSMKKLGKKAFW